MICTCPEAINDQALYGIHACKDGKRIDPFDLMPDATEDDLAEVRLKLRLSQLHSEYRERVQPFIDELVEIESRKPPKVMFVPPGFEHIPPAWRGDRRYQTIGGKLYCKHGILLYGTKCLTCERDG